MQDLLIYAGGAIQHFINEEKFYKATQWRENLLILLKESEIDRNITIYDPTSYFKERKRYSPETIIDVNTYYLTRADILVVNTFQLLNSPGTIREITYFYDNKKPRIGFNDHVKSQKEMDIYNGYTYTKMLTDNFNSLDEVIKYIKVCFYV